MFLTPATGRGAGEPPEGAVEVTEILKAAVTRDIDDLGIGLEKQSLGATNAGLVKQLVWRRVKVTPAGAGEMGRGASRPALKIVKIVGLHAGAVDFLNPCFQPFGAARTQD